MAEQFDSFLGFVLPFYYDKVHNGFIQLSWRSLAASLVATMAFTAWRYKKSSTSRNLPPGPPGFPLLGSVLELTTNDPWVTFTKWNKQYGPLVHVKIAGHSALILGSHKVAADLLDRRSAIYSDRPRNIVVHELMNGKLAFASGSADEFWKRMRKAAYEVLKNDVARSYYYLQETESVILMGQLLDSPQNYVKHVQRTSSSLMRTILYGLPPIQNSEDPVILYLDGFIERLVRGIAPGAYWVEYFTWMEHLPRWMSPWRRNAEECFKRDNAFFIKCFVESRERLMAGDDTPSISAKVIQDQSNSGLTDQEAAWLLATLYIAGTEARAGQMLWFMLAMCIFPEVQQRAFQEIDRVVGPDRLPSLQDHDQLPYIQACLKESMRWRPLAPAGIPHRLRQDDVYEGYFIPKDTICIPNAWLLNHDPDVYGADVEDFNPGRFLDAAGNLLPSIPDTKDEGHVTYGFGQRICVGRGVSNRSMFIEMASMIWCFKFTIGKDDHGNDLIPDTISNGVPGVAYRPVSFPCVMTPRSDEIKNMVHQAKQLRGVA